MSLWSSSPPKSPLHGLSFIISASAGHGCAAEVFLINVGS